jgi:hypothetical protein
MRATDIYVVEILKNVLPWVYLSNLFHQKWHIFLSAHDGGRIEVSDSVNILLKLSSVDMKLFKFALRAARVGLMFTESMISFWKVRILVMHTLRVISMTKWIKFWFYHWGRSMRLHSPENAWVWVGFVIWWEPGFAYGMVEPCECSTFLSI